jgi:hypothetical protein
VVCSEHVNKDVVLSIVKKVREREIRYLPILCPPLSAEHIVGAESIWIVK